MDTRADSSMNGGAKSAKPMLLSLDPQQAGSVVAAAADITLVVDSDGTIRDTASGAEDLSQFEIDQWLGKSWFDVVTTESRPKLKAMLETAASAAALKWRQITHKTNNGTEIPVRYATISLGDGRVLAIGRNMQALAEMQQRLVEAQMSMEREYARMRRAETRYRLLFQLASEAILILDAASSKVVEANPAACKLLLRDEKRLIGNSVSSAFDSDSRSKVQDLIAKIRDGATGETVSANTAESGLKLDLTGSFFRQDGNTFFLIRLVADENDLADGVQSHTSNVVQNVMETLPEGFVVTDLHGEILKANDAFLDMTQVGSEEQIKGRAINRWIGRSPVDLNVLMANLKEHGSVRFFATVLRNEFGSTVDIEISAVSVNEGEIPCIGFIIRNLDGRVTLPEKSGGKAPRSVEQLSKLVGRVPLKDLVQESTDIIESMCIEAALELTGDNRASAAEMLGLSRQSLYVKLRRHGLAQRD
ncbi:MAG: transcriptional regulator PpsR [Alphaproteobacteria bacterium]|nr:transcriptional regulator PpsR [Alphaproteobacteria bacterium]